MEYGLTKKLTFLLCEYVYAEEHRELENDICKIIHQLEQEEWYDLYNHYNECIAVLQSLRNEYGRPMYSWIHNIKDLIEYLEYLPVEIAESQMERQIARAESMADFIYENGYDEYITSGIYR